jgi:hypothetical protein
MKGNDHTKYNQKEINQERQKEITKGLDQKAAIDVIIKINRGQPLARGSRMGA